MTVFVLELQIIIRTLVSLSIITVSKFLIIISTLHLFLSVSNLVHSRFAHFILDILMTQCQTPWKMCDLHRVRRQYLFEFIYHWFQTCAQFRKVNSKFHCVLIWDSIEISMHVLPLKMVPAKSVFWAYQ